MAFQTTIDTARALLTDVSHIEVFTGAGMSADSGIATYRDAQTGLWENVDPQDMASIDAWHDDPDTMFAWYLWRAHLAQQAEPNAGHAAVAKSPKTTVTTQNIDNLHERAGSKGVVHLHGSLFDFRCSLCDESFAQPIDLPKETRDSNYSPGLPGMRRPSAPRRGLVRRGVAGSRVEGSGAPHAHR